MRHKDGSSWLRHIAVKSAANSFVPERILRNFVPLSDRRDFTPAEEQDIESNEDRFIPDIIQTDATPISHLLSSPAKGGLMYGVGGAGAGGLLGAGLGGLLGHPALGAAAGGALGAGVGGVHGYLKRYHNNEHLLEMMRRLPPGATKRDLAAEEMIAGALENRFGGTLGESEKYSFDKSLFKFAAPKFIGKAYVAEDGLSSFDKLAMTFGGRPPKAKSTFVRGHTRRSPYERRKRGSALEHLIHSDPIVDTMSKAQKTRSHAVGEACPHCGAMLECGDDGKCNQCRKPWPMKKASEAYGGQITSDSQPMQSCTVCGSAYNQGVCPQGHDQTKIAANRDCPTCGTAMKGAWCPNCRKFYWNKKAAEMSPFATGFIGNCMQAGMSTVQIKQAIDKLASQLEDSAVTELQSGLEKAAGIPWGAIGEGMGMLGRGLGKMVGYGAKAAPAVENVAAHAAPVVENMAAHAAPAVETAAANTSRFGRVWQGTKAVATSPVTRTLGGGAAGFWTANDAAIDPQPQHNLSDLITGNQPQPVPWYKTTSGWGQRLLGTGIGMLTANPSTRARLLANPFGRRLVGSATAAFAGDTAGTLADTITGDPNHTMARWGSRGGLALGAAVPGSGNAASWQSKINNWAGKSLMVAGPSAAGARMMQQTRDSQIMQPVAATAQMGQETSVLQTPEQQQAWSGLVQQENDLQTKFSSGALPKPQYDQQMQYIQQQKATMFSKATQDLMAQHGLDPKNPQQTAQMVTSIGQSKDPQVQSTIQKATQSVQSAVAQAPGVLGEFNTKIDGFLQQYLGIPAGTISGTSKIVALLGGLALVGGLMGGSGATSIVGGIAMAAGVIGPLLGFDIGKMLGIEGGQSPEGGGLAQKILGTGKPVSGGAAPSKPLGQVIPPQYLSTATGVLKQNGIDINTVTATLGPDGKPKFVAANPQQQPALDRVVAQYANYLR